MPFLTGLKFSVLHQLRKADHRRQRIVQFVRHAGYEFADARELFALDQLRLHLFHARDGFLEALRHLIECLGEFSAFVLRSRAYALRKIAVPNRLRADAQFAQWLHHPAQDEVHNHSRAEERRQSRHQQHILGADQRLHRFLIREQQLILQRVPPG